jgi:methylenetetrahydrofolate reductase (NADPH)
MVSVSFEFFPPKSPEGDILLWEVVKKLTAMKPAFCSVTYGAGGSTKTRTAEIVERIQRETGVPAASHLTCVNASKEEINEIAIQYWHRGIRRIVALRGDMPDMSGPYIPHKEGYVFAHELVRGLKTIADFDISVACFPETHPEAVSEEADIEYLKRKIDAGADRAIMQYCYDTDKILRFVEKVRAKGITVPLVPGIMPIEQFAQVVSFSKRCGASIPESMQSRFSAVIDDKEASRRLAVEVATEQCQRLLDSGLESLHFYTLNKADLTLEICQNVSVTA